MHTIRIQLCSSNAVMQPDYRAMLNKALDRRGFENAERLDFKQR